MIHRNPNLRKLAIAYAQGKLDSTEYRKLRTFQLSAIDFGKPIPELPPQYETIEIPSINIDPPNKPGPRRALAKLAKLVLALIILAALGGGAYYYYVTQDHKPSTRKVTTQQKKVALTLEQLAERLNNKRIWTNRDVNELKASWIKAGSAKQNAAKDADWFAELKSSITDRIAETKALVENGTGSANDQELLINLNLLYADLITE